MEPHSIHNPKRNTIYHVVSQCNELVVEVEHLIDNAISIFDEVEQCVRDSIGKVKNVVQLA